MGTLENDNDKVISNDTAAMYIALCYAGNYPRNQLKNAHI